MTAAPVLDALRRPLRDLRVSVTDRCNFRCPYCMPKEVYGEAYRFTPRAQLLTYEEIRRLVRLFARLGVTKVRLTGGEPLVRKDVDRLVAMLSGVPGVEDLTLTTNGYLLAAQARTLKEAGLQRITVSLDSLDDAVFRRMNGVGHGVTRVLEGIDAAVAAGLRPIKLNCVVQRGVNDHTIVDLARRFKGTGIIVRFIEYMDVGNLNGWRMEDVAPAAEIVRRIGDEFPLQPVEPNYPGEVAGRYRYLDGTGEIGVIASVTQPFCAACTRARLSPRGEVFTCLFGTKGTDLRGPMRAGASDDDLLDVISGLWRVRTDRYSELRTALTAPRRDKVEMFRIGG
jgi:cyclic pyranopterin phosphate synthase